MEDENGLDDFENSSRHRLAQLEWILVAGFGMILAFLLFLNVLAAKAISKGTSIFEEMLMGAPLPLLTQWIIGYGESGLAGMAAILLPVGTILFIFLKRRSTAAWYFSLGLIAFLMIQASVIFYGVWIGLSEIVTGSNVAL